MAILAGIAATNDGTIRDSYAVWDKNEKSKKSLVAQTNGKILTSALIVKSSCDEVYTSDGTLKTDYIIQKTSDLKNIGFNTADCWEYAGEDELIRFKGNSWHIAFKKTAPSEVHIKSTDDYILFADRVNNGDKRFIDAHVYLECDLDFKGRRIPVIGKTRETAFSGVFDGKSSYSLTYNYGDLVTVDNNKFENPGFTFIGWNTDKDATTALNSLTMRPVKWSFLMK